MRAVECLQQAEPLSYTTSLSRDGCSTSRAPGRAGLRHRLPGLNTRSAGELNRTMVEEAKKGRSCTTQGRYPFVLRVAAARKPRNFATPVWPMDREGSTGRVGPRLRRIPLTKSPVCQCSRPVTGQENPAKPGSAIVGTPWPTSPARLLHYCLRPAEGSPSRDRARQGATPRTRRRRSPASLAPGTSQRWKPLLAELPSRPGRGLAARVILVGPVTERRPDTSWFESRP